MNGTHGSNFKVVELWAESRNSSKAEGIVLERASPLARSEEMEPRGPPLAKIDFVLGEKLKETETTTKLAGNLRELMIAIAPGYINSLK